MDTADLTPVVLDGARLSISDLVRVARDPRVEVRCEPQALQAVQRGWDAIRQIVADYQSALSTGRPLPRVYGVTTGFGEFKNKRIEPAHFEQMQRNILLSHSVGVGDNADPNDPINYFPVEVVRGALLLRLNAFLKGHSGVRPELVECIRRMLNRGIVPLVPIRGSLGASGDLCPLAHLFVVLLGEGRYFVVKGPEDLEYQTYAGVELREARTHLAADLGYETLPTPSFKEGLALTNGANFSAAMLALAVHDAERLANVADVSAALTLEGICGRTRAFDPRVHAARGLDGQCDSAANLRQIVTGSRQMDRADDVQDAYSVRCTPQVHGATRDAIAYARMVVERECNAATDNPLFFPGAGEPWDKQTFYANRPESFADLHAYSAGNFHGQPLALAADFLTIGVAELADIAERRTQMLLDARHNRYLPSNLIAQGGLNTGYMIAQYTAASVVSENKVLSHPASVDSIPSSSNTEDHVSMSTIAARKLRTVLGNAQAVLAIELLVAAQAVDWRVGMQRDPNTPAAAMSGAEESVAFDAATKPERRAAIAALLGRGTGAAYLALRRVAEPMLADRMLEPDIRAVRRIIDNGTLLAAVNARLETPLRGIPALERPHT
ncbi:MAG: histidine ammonia-lyase [Phycisphaerae bacterium]|nr:histidine ammonia-lyase [Phycisphaerae bacterium]